MLMALPMYLLRRPAKRVSSALYSTEKDKIVVRLREVQPDDPASSQEAAVMQIGNENSLANEQPLNYRQLLELVLHTEKVVTL